MLVLGLNDSKDIILRGKDGKTIARIIRCPGSNEKQSRIGIEADRSISITRETRALALAV